MRWKDLTGHSPDVNIYKGGIATAPVSHAERVREGETYRVPYRNKKTRAPAARIFEPVSMYLEITAVDIQRLISTETKPKTADILVLPTRERLP